MTNTRLCLKKKIGLRVLGVNSFIYLKHWRGLIKRKTFQVKIKIILKLYLNLDMHNTAYRKVISKPAKWVQQAYIFNMYYLKGV